MIFKYHGGMCISEEELNDMVETWKSAKKKCAKELETNEEGIFEWCIKFNVMKWDTERQALFSIVKDQVAEEVKKRAEIC